MNSLDNLRRLSIKSYLGHIPCLCPRLTFRLLSSSSSGDDNGNHGNLTDESKYKQNVKHHPPFSRPRTKAAARMQAMTLHRQGRLKNPSSSGTNKTKSKSPIDSKVILSECQTRRILYKRNPKSHYPTFLLTGTTLHSSYWLWYLTDFTNTLQNAGMHVSAPLGYIGFGLSAMMFAAASLYPRHLISEISVAHGIGTGQDAGCIVKVHSLPFGRAEQSGGTYYPRGQLEYGNNRDKDKLQNHPENLPGGRDVGHIAVSASDKSLYLLLDTKNGIVQDSDALNQLLTGKLIS